MFGVVGSGSSLGDVSVVSAFFGGEPAEVVVRVSADCVYFGALVGQIYARIDVPSVVTARRREVIFWRVFAVVLLLASILFGTVRCWIRFRLLDYRLGRL